MLNNLKKNLSLRTFFLYGALIFLPIFIVYFTINTLIQETYRSDIQKVKNELELQKARVEIFSQPKHQIKDFLDVLLHTNKLTEYSPQELKIFMDRLDKLYPEAFGWLVWDEKGEILPIISRNILAGRRSWNVIIKELIKHTEVISNANTLFNKMDVDPEFDKAIAYLQKSSGSLEKIEHLRYANDKIIDFVWLGRPCYAIWDVVATGFKKNLSVDVKGGALMLVFPDKLPENIWRKRMIVRRKTAAESLKYPIITFNLTDSYLDIVDKDLKLTSEQEDGFMEAYKNRSHNFFKFEDYLCIASLYDDVESQTRIISLANIKKINQNKKRSEMLLVFVCLLILGTTFYYALTIDWQRILDISLRTRIAWIFLTATSLPLISLIVTGNNFIIHEETRLKESALVKMRAGIEGLNLRYQDVPRILEKKLFGDIHNALGAPPFTMEDVLTKLKGAVDDKLIGNFALIDNHAKLIHSSWKNLDPSVQKMLELGTKRSIVIEEMHQNAGTTALDYVDEELTSILTVLNTPLDFSRPSFLRYFAIQNEHMHFMNIHLFLDEFVYNLIVQIPEEFLEKHFAQSEFAANRLAMQQEEESNEGKIELSFFATQKGEASFPEISPVFTALKKQLEVAHSLKTEETGEITLGDESFIYLIKPLTSMRSQSMLPCYLYSINHVLERLSIAKLVLVFLAVIAVLGTVVLSLILASSLLQPIKTIDEAAQRVGRGDFGVAIPEMGKDELGRLSATFNNMVKGLREHEKMQAYVSDSVKEAIQGDDTEIAAIRSGKNMEATILFSDIRNFTTITEQNPPSVVFSLLNEFFGSVEPIIRMNHGRVDKYIGDAVMAIFHRDDVEHHALSAIKAAVLMKKFVNKLNKNRVKKGLFPINIGVGISTGTVLLGDVGSKTRKDLTVIGDEVNLASRLETASKSGRHTKIVFSGSTYEVVKKHVRVEKMSFSEVRGKEQTVTIYELISMNN